jgi:hypothetical protein
MTLRATKTSLTGVIFALFVSTASLAQQGSGKDKVVLLNQGWSQDPTGLLSAASPAPAPTEEELLNNGEDFTNPINRFDTRFQFQGCPTPWSRAGSSPTGRPRR